MNNSIHEMKTKLEKELSKYANKSELTPSEWDAVFNAVDAYKDLETICAMQDAGGDYHEDGGQSYGRRRYYPMGNSYGESYYPQHEYSSERANNMSYGGASYHGSGFQDKLRGLMDSATTEQERQIARDMMSRLQNNY